MYRSLLLGILCLVSLLTKADTCPQAPSGYIFRVAAWGDHNRPLGKVRCYYYSSHDETMNFMKESPDRYTEKEMESSWGPYAACYNLCISYNNNVNDCRYYKSNLMPWVDSPSNEQ